MHERLTADMATAFAGVALANIDRRYPHKLDHLIVAGPEPDAADHVTLHPIFHGSYDWHSSVHMHWLLGRLADALPEHHNLAEAMSSAARRHLAAGLPHTVGGDYVGEHWLASFAALALGDMP